MNGDPKPKIFQFLRPKHIADITINGDIQIIHQSAGLIATVFIFLFFHVRNVSNK